LRGLVHPDHWSNRLGTWALVSFNAAIVLWLALNILPIGTAQFSATVEQGYSYARSVAFYQHWIAFHWLRLPGDVAFLVGGALLLVDVVSKLRYRRAATVGDGQPMDVAGQATLATS
jgi:nitric oxide reductase subunit B